MPDVSNPDYEGVCCPNCQSTPLDGMDKMVRTFTKKRPERPDTNVKQMWSKRHCPECGQKFATLESEDEWRVGSE